MGDNLNIDGIEISIEKSGGAWGDGNHESTQFMMQSIVKYGVKDKVVLDIGTGTGILSVLCGKLGAKDILAIDVEESIVECAKANFKANGVEAKAICNYLTQNLDYKADVVLANLQFPIQHQNVDTIADKLKDDGIFIMTWENIFSFERFVKGFEIIEHVKGPRDYDGYVLRKA